MFFIFCLINHAECSIIISYYIKWISKLTGQGDSSSGLIIAKADFFMNIIVVGCGKVGANLANVLSEQGHDVSVVDRNEDSFASLDPEFSGFTTVGVPIDQDILRKAGIDSCDALAAVTNDDNANIMIAQMAKNIFRVPKVITRIYDPERGEVFRQFGLETICPTSLTVASVCAALNDKAETVPVHMGSHTVMFQTMDIPKEYIGLRVSEIVLEKDETLFAIEHEDHHMQPVFLSNPSLKEGDRLIFAKFAD